MHIQVYNQQLFGKKFQWIYLSEFTGIQEELEELRNIGSQNFSARYNCTGDNVLDAIEGSFLLTNDPLTSEQANIRGVSGRVCAVVANACQSTQSPLAVCNRAIRDARVCT